MNTIYKQYHSKLLVFINSKVQNAEDAQDILSEVFIKIHNNIQKIDSDEKLTSWIYTITRNTIAPAIASKLPMIPDNFNNTNFILLIKI